MSRERELMLLSQAARAIDHDLHVNMAEATQLWKNGEYVCFWMPLDGNSDALDLAVRLMLSVSIGPLNVSVTSIDLALRNIFITETMVGQDFHEATRRAIVRAAAAIGAART